MSEEESSKEPEDYRKFIYCEPDTLPKERGIITSELTKLQTVQTESQSQSVQPKLELEGTELEGTELLPNQTEIEDTELILDETKHEEPNLQSTQPKLQLGEPELDIEISRAKEPVLAKYARWHHAP